MSDKILYNFDKPISRIGTYSEKYDALKKYYGTDDIEPFWVADMDLPSPEFLIQALNRRVNHSLFGYTEKNQEIFEAIKWWMHHQHNTDIDNEFILLSPSVVTTMSMVIQSFSSMNDNILIFSPVYGPFFSTVKLHKRNVIDFPLSVDNSRFYIDLERLEKIIIHKKIKLLFLCNPHNPGGRVWKKNELEALVKICVKNNIIIFSDEIHSDIVFKPASHISILTIPEAREISIMGHSIGKTFNTSGLKSSFSITPNKNLRKELEKSHKLAHADNINLFGKIAIQTLLSEKGVEYKNQLIKYLNENINLVYEKLSNVEELKPMLPEATFLVWCDFTSFGNWNDTSKTLINHTKIALSGGSFFGKAGEGWFRINCGHPRKLLLKAVDRICETFTR